MNKSKKPLLKKNDFLVIGKNCKIATSATIMTGSVIGKKFRKLLTGVFDNEDYATKIGENVYIGYYCLVGNGSTIEKGSILDDQTVIESDVHIGQKTLLIYKSQLCNEVKIGNNCVIGGFIGERTIIGNDCRVFGSIVHYQLHPMNPWDDDNSVEKHVTIKDKVFVGFNSVIAGEITIGPQAYVVAGSTITEDVPPKHIAFGRNQMMHHTKWKGELKNCNLFK